jgi:hypothetical protein
VQTVIVTPGAPGPDATVPDPEAREPAGPATDTEDTPAPEDEAAARPRRR